MKQFDLDAFKAFVASKPAGEEYDWSDTRHCALAQFGCINATASALGEYATTDDGVVIPFAVYDAAALTSPHTFGALSERLNALASTEGQHNG